MMEVVVVKGLQLVRRRVAVLMVDLEVSLLKVKGFKRVSG